MTYIVHTNQHGETSHPTLELMTNFVNFLMSTGFTWIGSFSDDSTYIVDMTWSSK